MRTAALMAFTTPVKSADNQSHNQLNTQETDMTRAIISAVTALTLSLLFSGAHAGAHSGGGGGHKQIGQYSGFEGNEEELGAVIVAAILEAGGTEDPKYNLRVANLKWGLPLRR